MSNPKDVYREARDAGTGRFVSIAYALKHLRTTVIETIRRRR